MKIRTEEDIKNWLQDLHNNHGAVIYLELVERLHEMSNQRQIQRGKFVVYCFEDAPWNFQQAFSRGGDEDWIVITTKLKDEWMPRWIEVMEAVDEPVRFDILDQFTIFVGAHA